MSKELKEAINKALEKKHRGICIISAEILQAVLNYIDKSIPKEVVERKIEEIDEELEIMKVDNMYGRYREYGGKSKWEKLFANKYNIHDILQELLEGK